MPCRLPQPMIPEEQGRGGKGLVDACWSTGGLDQGGFSAKEPHLVMTHEGCRGQICEELPGGEQGPHDIDRETRVYRLHLAYAHPRMGLHEGKHRLLLRRITGHPVCPKILQKLQVVNIQRVILGRRADLIVYAQWLSPCVAWRTVPHSPGIALIAVGHGHSKRVERAVSFPFLKGDASVPQDAEIRGMPLRRVSARGGTVP